MQRTEHAGHDHEKCKELFQYLSEYIDDELNEDLCDKIEAHLGNCACCQTCLLTLKKTIKLCGGIEDQPIPERLSEKLKNLFSLSKQPC